MQVALPKSDWIIGKHALLNVHAVRRNGRTEIDPKSWRIPYQWQGCHYQDNDDQPFLLLINSGGGFVEGDASDLHAKLEPNTRALITTTSASKFYKCLNNSISREIANFSVGEGALLEYLPDEAIPFAKARVERQMRFDLASSARLFATDMIAAGRIHYRDGEAFSFSSLRSDFLVLIDGREVLVDRLIAQDAEEVEALARLWDGAMHLATVVSYAPDLPGHIEDEVNASLTKLDVRTGGVTRLGDMIVCRILSDEAWRCHEAVYAVWAVLRPSLAGKAARPIRKC